MFKLLTIIITTIAFVLGILWLNENSGIIDINWLGYKIKTNTSFFVLVFVVLFLVLVFLFQLLLTIFNFPSKIKNLFFKQSDNYTYKNLEHGVLNLLSNDLSEAKKVYAKLVNNIGNDSHYKNLFNAFEAKLLQADGNFIEAKKSYEKLLDNKNTKFFAVKGLVESTSLEGNLTEAKNYAEKAYELKPNFKDGAVSLLELYKNTKDYDSAFNFLKKYKKKIWFKKDFNNQINIDKEYSYLWLEKAKDILKEPNISPLKKILAYDFIIKSLKYDNGNLEAINLLLVNSEKTGNINDLIKYFRKFWAYNQNNELTKKYLEITSKNKKKKAKYINEELLKLSKIKLNTSVLEKLKTEFVI